MDAPKYNAEIIADYFLYKAQNDSQELLSNLKLQKLVYYAQGLHLAMKGAPLFDEEIKAWEYGPVIPELYHKFKSFGSEEIKITGFDPNIIDDKTREFLDEVFSVLGQFSAIGLMNLTHEDQCWKDAYPNEVITKEAMQIDLKKYIKEDE